MVDEHTTAETEPVKPYHLTTDELLQRAAVEDTHLRLVLDGLGDAERRAAQDPTNPTYQTIAAFAEQSVRRWVELNGYGTQETAPPQSSDDL